MNAGLIVFSDTGEMRLRNPKTGEVIENLVVKHVHHEVEMINHFTGGGRRIIDQQIPIGRRITMEVEVLMQKDDFEFVTQHRGESPKPITVEALVRVVRIRNNL